MPGTGHVRRKVQEPRLKRNCAGSKDWTIRHLFFLASCVLNRACAATVRKRNARGRTRTGMALRPGDFKNEKAKFFRPLIQSCSNSFFQRRNRVFSQLIFTTPCASNTEGRNAAKVSQGVAQFRIFPRFPCARDSSISASNTWRLAMIEKLERMDYDAGNRRPTAIPENRPAPLHCATNENTGFIPNRHAP